MDAALHKEMDSLAFLLESRSDANFRSGFRSRIDRWSADL